MLCKVTGYVYAGTDADLIIITISDAGELRG
jgi:hypothetical protein